MTVNKSDPQLLQDCVDELFALQEQVRNDQKKFVNEVKTEDGKTVAMHMLFVQYAEGNQEGEHKNVGGSLTKIKPLSSFLLVLYHQCFLS